MYKRLAAATLALSMMVPASYAQQPSQEVNLQMQAEQYLSPVKSVFRVDLRAIYEKAKDIFSGSKNKGVPNPHLIVLRDPVEELRQQDEMQYMLEEALKGCGEDTACSEKANQKYRVPPVLLDGIEAHLNLLAKFRAEQISKTPSLESALTGYDPSKTLVPAFDFGSDIKNIQYSTSARLTDPENGRGMDALVTYFEFHPDGQENDLQYRVIVPIEEITKVEGEDFDYFERSYNKVRGVIQAKQKSEPDTAWKILDNPTLDRLKNEPKRKQGRDPYMPDATQRGPSITPGQSPHP